MPSVKDLVVEGLVALGFAAAKAIFSKTPATDAQKCSACYRIAAKFKLEAKTYEARMKRKRALNAQK